MGSPAEETFQTRLAGECPRRVCAQLHAAGGYRHYLNPASGRVCCFAPGSPPPEGFRASAAQAASDAHHETPQGG